MPTTPEKPSSAVFLPPIQFDPELPVVQRLDDIRQTILKHQVVVVCGETGSGKSTQLPKLLLEMGYGQQKKIGHTQPRRLAARSVAARIAEELQNPLGEIVGYKIRFADQTGKQTRIKMMTDGILLAEIQQDRWLNQYDAIILDEAHERSLNIDLLIGILKRVISKRKDLRLIITSATIDAERFSQHFTINGLAAPVLQVAGRTHSVDILYRPIVEDEETDDDQPRDVFAAICDGVKELNRIDRGDILIFLPTEQDIRLATKSLRGLTMQRSTPDCDILPLYARLSTKDQNRIFHPGQSQRIILATNVAESSITVPRIKHVIDTGTARLSRYSPRSKIQRLPIEPISQASANQRSGRCGRLGPGTCIRLYSEADFLSREPFTTPEIRRTNLASVILQTKTMNLGEIQQIPFLDPPHTESIRAGYKTLFEIGAVDDRRELTELGRKLSRLPIDPRLARMIVAAGDEGCLADVLIIAAALEIRDPRERPVERRQAADEAHARFRDAQSDFISLLKIWDFFHDLKSSLSHSKFRKACAQNFLSFNRIREWQDVQRQLRLICQQIGLHIGSRSNDSGKIHRSLLAGLLSGIAMKGESFEFTGAGGGKFFLWPGSSLFRQPAKWIVAAEMVETERRYLRTVARIDPGWIEPLASHLLKYSYSDPHFSTKTCACMAYEKVSLFGLPIVPRRRVHYGKIDPEVARQIFIEEGLVKLGYRPEQGLIAENQALVESVGSLAQKTRQRDLVIDPSVVYAFYDKCLPVEVVDARTLERYIKDANQAQREPLRINLEQLVADQTQLQDVARQFPDQMPVGELQVPLDYRFEPGGESDGVTLRIPVQAIRQLNPRQLDWLVPGLVADKVTALIRSLPKPLRRHFVPAPDTAKRVAKEIDFGQGIFVEVVALHLSRIAGEPIRSTDFQLDKVDAHLQAHIEAIDESGEVIAKGRDLVAIRTELQLDSSTAEIKTDDERWNRAQITGWDFGELLKQVEISSDPVSVVAYPALRDRGSHVDLVLLDSAGLAKLETAAGLTRLYAIAARKLIRAQVQWLPQFEQMQVQAMSIMHAEIFKQQVFDLIARRAFVESEKKFPRDADEFQTRLENGAERTAVAAQEISRLLPKLFQNLHAARLALEELPEKSGSLSDSIQMQLDRMLPADFLTTTPARWLTEFPRFLQAILVRLDKLPQRGIAEDSRIASEIEQLFEKYQTRRRDNLALGVFDHELEQYRWMLEEYRVSSFAQGLGTSISVSPQRLEKQWDKALRSIAQSGS